MHTYAVYRQYFPLTVVPARPKLGLDAEYEACIKFQGYVEAHDGHHAAEQARWQFGLLAPIVERVVH